MRSADQLTSVEVPVISLDTFARDHNLTGIDLLKIDTESTEPEVLRGAVEMLRRDHPSIVCEVLSGRGSEGALDEVLRPLGYRYYLLTPEGPALRERIEGHPGWLNYFFTTLAPHEVASL
jgi:hypothetical protein